MIAGPAAGRPEGGATLDGAVRFGVARKTAPLFVARITSAATTLLLLAVVSRQRGAIDLGAVALGLTIGTLLGGASEAGMTSWMVREIAREPRRSGRLLAALLALRALLLPPLAVLSTLFIMFAFDEDVAVIVVVTLSIAIQQVAETGRGVFIAHGRMGIAGAHGTVENLLWLAAILLGLEVGASTALAFGLGLVIMAVSALSIVGLTWMAGWPLQPYGSRETTAIRSELPVFGAFSIASAASLKIDTILLGLLLPSGAFAAAGAYFGATRLVAAFEYLPQTLGRAVLPDVARAVASSARGLRHQALGPAVGILLSLSVPVPFAMVLGGTWMLQILLGAGAASFGWIMAWIALALPFRFVAYLYGTLLTGADAQGPRLKALLVSLAVLVIADVITIPVLGVAGAVVGLLAASLTLFVLYERASRLAIEAGDTARRLIRPLALSVGAFIPGLIAKAALPEPVSAPAALAVFVMVYLLVGGTYIAHSLRLPLAKDLDAVR